MSCLPDGLARHAVSPPPAACCCPAALISALRRCLGFKLPELSEKFERLVRLELLATARADPLHHRTALLVAPRHLHLARARNNEPKNVFCAAGERRVQRAGCRPRRHHRPEGGAGLLQSAGANSTRATAACARQWAPPEMSCCCRVRARSSMRTRCSAACSWAGIKAASWGGRIGRRGRLPLSARCLSRRRPLTSRCAPPRRPRCTTAALARRRYSGRSSCSRGLRRCRSRRRSTRCDEAARGEAATWAASCRRSWCAVALATRCPRRPHALAALPLQPHLAAQPPLLSVRASHSASSPSACLVRAGAPLQEDRHGQVGRDRHRRGARPPAAYTPRPSPWPPRAWALPCPGGWPCGARSRVQPPADRLLSSHQAREFFKQTGLVPPRPRLARLRRQPALPRALASLRRSPGGIHAQACPPAPAARVPLARDPDQGRKEACRGAGT